MNPNQQQSPTGNPLLDALLAGSNQQKNVQSLMGGPIGQLLQNRQQYLDKTNNDIGSGVNNMMANGQNGVAVNAGPSMQELNQNFAGNNAITQGLLGDILNSATSYANNSQGNAVSAVNNQVTNATTQRGQNLQYMGTPNDSTTSSGTNPRVDNWTQSIMNGYKSIGDVPGDIAPLVTKALAQKGYDPAKEVWNDINNLQNTYNQGGGLATGNNLSNKVGMSLGDLLNMVTFGAAKTSGEQQKQDYTDATKNFTKKYAGILGNNVALPSPNDTADQAKKKFNALANTVRAKFYQGGNPPGLGSNTKDPLNLGL